MISQVSLNPIVNNNAEDQGLQSSLNLASAPLYHALAWPLLPIPRNCKIIKIVSDGITAVSRWAILPPDQAGGNLA